MQLLFSLFFVIQRIEFVNPYPVGKTFYLKCDREDILHFGNTTLNVSQFNQSISGVGQCGEVK